MTLTELSLQEWVSTQQFLSKSRVGSNVQQCPAIKADRALAGPLQLCLLTGIREGFWVVSSSQVMVSLMLSWEAAFGGPH